MAPLIGRQRETDEVLAAVAPPGAGAVIVGVSGVGKSRLVAAILDAAARRGQPVVTLRASHANGTRPFAAFSDVLSRSALASQDELAVLRLARSTLAGMGDRPVVGVDDAHLLDPGSATAVLHVVRTGEAAVAATVLSGTAPPDSVTALWKEGLARRIELGPLDEGAAEELARDLLPEGVERRVVDWLWGRGEGNPRIVHNLVESARESGCLRLERDVWRLGPDPPVPPRLRAAVGRRWDALGPSGRRAVAAVAVAGSLDHDILTALVGADGVGAAERAGFLVVASVDGTNTVAMAHRIEGDTVRALITASARRALLEELVEYVESSGTSALADERVAVWRIDAGLPTPPAALIDAARDAHRRGDDHLSIRLAERALGAGRRTDATLAFAVAAVAVGRYDDAESALAAAESDLATTPAVLAAYVALRIRNLAWGLRQPGRARTVIARLDGLRHDDAWRRLVRVQRAVVGLAEGRLEDALELAVPVVADRACDPLVRLHAATPALHALTMSNRPNASVRLADDLLPLAGAYAQDLPGASDWIRHQLCVALAVEGRTDRLTATLPALAGRAGATVRSYRAFEAGAMQTAQRELREWAGVQGDPVPNGPVDEEACCLLARVRAWLGDPTGAREILDAMGPEAVDPTIAPHRVSAVAWTRAAEGDPHAASAILLDWAEHASASPAHQARALVDAVRLGADPQHPADLLRALARNGDSELTTRMADFVEAHAAGDGGRLERVALELGAMGWRVLSADVLALACASHRAAGDQPAAARANAHAASVAASLDGVTTPCLARVPRPSLTPRQREVAMLAGAGLGNVEIAERLQLSVRTVEWHLRRAYEQLGTSDRAELGALLAYAAVR